jgi:Asp-tRNA(Asn)/Glu-tRNA(Gln) amidotransferase A subunit family amidase
MSKTSATLAPNPLLDAPDLASLGLAAGARAIRSGDITSEKYTAALLQRAQTLAELNTFITIDQSAALEAARAADKARAAGSATPLLGVPVGVKDSYLTKGLPTSLGIGALTHFVPQENAGAVSAIAEAGAVILGKNNLVEMSYGLTGHNARYGQVKNPHARDRVSGGSSSGSAASVAAGIVPASLGGDTVGSIRVPASLCGVVGFKPTTGRWPRDGVAPISHTLDTTGVFARSVEDCALMDRVVTGEHDGQRRGNAKNIKGVRLAYAPRQFLELVDPEIETRFHDVLRQLRAAGAEIAEVDLGEDFSDLIQSTTWSIFFHETAKAIPEFLRHHAVPTTFEEIYESLKPELREAWAHRVLPGGAGAVSAEAYQALLSMNRPEIQRRLEKVFRVSEAILLPTTPTTAPLIEQQASFPIAGRPVTSLALANHTVSASSVGLPAISLPMGLSSSGLPMGLELDAPLNNDRALLSLARRIEGVLGSRSMLI